MLLRVVLENFLSFDEAVQFDMFPNGKRTNFSEHIYQCTIPVLKQAAIYGANGAGKSNLIKGVDFIRRFALDKAFISSLEIDRYFFKLKPSATEKPLSIAIEFSIANTFFIYIIELSAEAVEKEALYYSGLGKKENEVVFIRERHKVSFASKQTEAIAVAVETMLKNNPLSSLLSLNKEFPIIENNAAKQVYSWFDNRLEVVKINSNIPSLIILMEKDKRLLNFTNKVFSEIDLGIKKLDVRSEDFEIWLGNHARMLDELSKKTIDSIKPGKGITGIQSTRPTLYISVEDGIRKVSQFIFEQLGKNGFYGEMDILSQSDGTVRLLTLIPAIYNAVYKEKTVFIDEINHCIHPSLIRALVAYFANNHETKGQLIFTTHETCLLDQKEIMRPDEVWFAQKKEGATQLYSLNDYKIHHSISIENGYLEGRFGAIPFIGTLE